MTPEETEATINAMQCRIDTLESVLSDLANYGECGGCVKVKNLAKALKDADILQDVEVQP